MTVIIEDILDNKNKEVFTGKAVFVIAGVEPEVEDEDVEAIDKEQCFDTMKEHREKQWNTKVECNRKREKERISQLNSIVLESHTTK